MKPSIAEFPKHPDPSIPQPPAPQQPQTPLPTVYVYERQQWEYRIVTKKLGSEPSVSDADLNALGRDGWELVGVVAVSTAAQFVFKRAKA